MDIKFNLVPYVRKINKLIKISNRNVIIIFGKKIRNTPVNYNACTLLIVSNYPQLTVARN